MYVMVVFALALLSPLPFVSPFDNIVQDATAQNIPPGAPSFEIIPHLIPSPFGNIMQDPNDPHFIEHLRKVNTFEIGNSIYCSIHSITITDGDETQKLQWMVMTSMIDKL